MAAELANTALSLGHAHGFSVWPERVAVILGRLLVEQGSIAEGLARAEEAVRQVAAIGSTGWRDDFSAALLAGAYGIAGQSEKGLQVIEPLAARDSTGFYQPEIHRIRGELLLAIRRRPPERRKSGEVAGASSRH